MVLHESSKPEAMNELLHMLQRIEPNTLLSRSVTRLQSKNYLVVMKVLKKHNNNHQFFLQFFKHVDKCECRACELYMWKPRRLPAPIFEAVHTSLLRMPLPILQPHPETGVLGTKEVHYMTLEEAFRHGVFTDEHQPSKIAERKERAAGHWPWAIRRGAPADGRGRGRPPAAPTAEVVPTAQPEAVSGNALSSRVLV
eukprot:jgi/Tetstr1/442382/TSEL_030508.t1